MLVWGKFYPFLHTAVKFKSHNGETDASAEGELCTNDLSAVRVKRSCMLHINGRPDGVFGLFDPIGEKKWSEDWNPIIVYPTSGIRQGSVFATRDDGTETIWIITKLDKSSRSIVYTSVTPHLKVSTIDIRCEPDGASRTKARVTYTVTALSERGNQHITSFSKEYYREWMMNWERAINHYLQYGRPLRHH